MTDLRKLKDKASEAFVKGKFAKASELYADYCARDPRDLQARLRMGDAFAKSGNKDKAILAYQAAAEGFAKDGFLPRAIAASKLILEIDPTHTEVQRMLADLYAKKGGRGEVAKSAVPTEKLQARRGAFEASTREVTPWALRKDAIELSDEDSEAAKKAVTPKAGADAFASGGREIDFAAEDTAEGVVLELETEPEDRSKELPPELDLEVVPPPPPAVKVEPAPAPAPKVAHPPEAAAVATPTVLEPPAPALGPPPTLRATSVVAAAPPPPPPRSPSLSSVIDSRFDELQLEDDELVPELPDFGVAGAPSYSGESLLHAVEAAAHGAGTAVDDEPLVGEPAPGELPKIPLFSDLSFEAFIKLFESCPLVRVAPGERVFAQGTPGNSFFVICSGSVRVLREEGGQKRQVAMLSEGAFFGEMALLSGAPRTATVEAAGEETQLLEISGPVLEDLSRAYPQVAVALRNFCRERLLANVMSSSALFRPFGAEDKKELIGRFQAREAQPNEILVTEGKRSDGLYVILSGEAAVVRGGKTLARLKEGEIFGETSLLRKAPAGASVAAVKRTSLLRLARQDFDELILSHPQILELVSELSEDRQKKNEAARPGEGIAGGGPSVLV